MLAAALADAIALRVRRPRVADGGNAGSRTPTAIAIDVSVAAWVAVSVLSTLLGASPHLSLLGEIGQREGLLTTIALAGLYAGTRRSHLDPAHARHTLGLVVACGALAAAYGLLQVAGFDPLAWASAPTYPVDGIAVPRAFGTLGNPILLGSLLAAALSAGATRLALGGVNGWRIGPAVALIGAGAVATLSRGAWLACASGMGVALAGGLGRGVAHGARRAGWTLAAVAAPALLWIVLALRAPLAARLAELSDPESGSNAARAEIARVALALWRAHPVSGTGPDAFGLAFPGVQSAKLWSAEWLGIPVQAHSVPLQVLATLGTAGALAGLAWLLAVAWALARPWSAGRDEAHAAARTLPPRDPLAERGDRIALGAALLALVIAGTVNAIGPAGASCFVVFSALAAGRDRVAPPAGHGRVFAGAAALGTILVVAMAGAREMSALAAAGSSHSALEQSAGADAESRAALADHAARQAQRAVALAPGDDELWRLACDASLAHAEAAMARRDLGAAGSAAANAGAAAAEAVRLVPQRASNQERLANALVARSRIAAALSREGAGGAGVEALADSAGAAFAEAKRLAPADALILTDEVRGQLLLGRPERALVAARRITALYPGAATGHALEAGTLLSLGRPDAAREALLRARAARWEDGSEPQRRAAEDLLRALGGPADSTR